MTVRHWLGLVVLCGCSRSTTEAPAVEHQRSALGAPRLAASTNDSTTVVTSSAPSGFVPLDATRSLFVATTPSEERELWVTNGTDAGTALLLDMSPGPQSPAGVGKLIVWNGVGYFVGNDGVHGYEFWRTDGTRPGTWLVFDSVPGEPSGIFDIVPLDTQLLLSGRRELELVGRAL